MSIPFRLRLVAVLSLVAIAATAVPATASPARIVGISAGAAAAKPQGAARYWTSARMKAARPMPAPKTARRAPRNGITTERAGTPRLIAAGPGANLAIPAGDPNPSPYAYPFPYTRYRVENALYTLDPYRTVGKVFFRQGGIDYVCSGASVVGGPRHVVFTAGHCLSDGAGTYSRRIVFVPAYRNGQAPFGTFPWKNLRVLQGWHLGGDLSVDMGAFVVAKNEDGITLRKAVGKLGFAFNLTRDLHWNVFGYPAVGAFNGQTMHVCQASRATDDLSMTGKGQSPIGIGCDLTGGSSGGPWIFRFKRGSFLNGVISYGYDEEQPEGTYGPYFGPQANKLRCAAGTGNVNATTC